VDLLSQLPFLSFLLLILLSNESETLRAILAFFASFNEATRHAVATAASAARVSLHSGLEPSQAVGIRQPIRLGPHTICIRWDNRNSSGNFC
jgi:hypothetical protein